MSGNRRAAPAWWAPQVLVAALLLLAGIQFALRGPEGPPPPPSVAFPSEPGDPVTAVEVELAVVEESGLERVVFRDVPLPDEDAARYEAIFAALRTELIEAGSWPANVPAPRAFAQRISGRDVVVLDVRVPGDVSVDASVEWRVVRSIQATAERHDADVRILVNGAAADTLFGHVAVASELTPD